MTLPLLTEWLPPNSDPDRPQVILSTVSADGGADARTVLLTEFDDDGLYFHTDSRSRKVRDIAANPAVAMTFLWPNFTRQLVVQGVASIAPAFEQLAAFEARSPYLKQLAWLNSAEFAQLPLGERVAQWAAFPMAEHPDPPSTWIGFIVRPTRLTFWESNPDAASRREEHRLVDGAWSVSYLAG
ncbi:MAG: pyridoxine 5-phosphate oxidase [Rhodoglobus sp.]|nr:pyridoxine 5-phosphate oxidase [Rhodoglobus sp.]